MTRWTTITAPPPTPWHPDEYAITFNRPDPDRVFAGLDCNVHAIVESGTSLLRKHPSILTPCPHPARYKVYANGILLSTRRSCDAHRLPDHWLPHAHYAAGIRPHRIGGHAITPGPVTFGTPWSHRW